MGPVPQGALCPRSLGLAQVATDSRVAGVGSVWFPYVRTGAGASRRSASPGRLDTERRNLALVSATGPNTLRKRFCPVHPHRNGRAPRVAGCVCCRLFSVSG